MATEPAFSLLITVLGLSYVLTYAWAQLEILAILIGSWKRRSKPLVLLYGTLWAVMNCFSFLIAHNVHFDVLRERQLLLRIDLFGHGIIDSTSPGARAGALCIILFYWVWVIGTFYLAILHSRRTRQTEQEEETLSP